jgi:tetratricopeptide (TPR) repeat protein
VSTLKDSHDEKELVQFLNNAGVKLSQGNDIEGALRMYQACVDQLQDSKYLYAIHYNMALAHSKMGNQQLAVESAKKSLQIKPDFDKAQKILKDFPAAG